MKKARMLSELILIFFVGAVWYCAVVGGALVRNARQELRKKH